MIYAGNNTYYIKSGVEGSVLDVKGGNSASGARIWTYPSNGPPAQKWYVYEAGAGFYYIQSALGTFLDVQGGSTQPQTNILANSYTGA